jgi:hypothetical protein
MWKSASMPLNQPSISWRPIAPAVCLALALTGWTMDTSQAATAGRQSSPEGRQLDPQQAERLKTVMTPLLQKMNHPISLDQVRIGLMDDSHINAAKMPPMQVAANFT